VKTNKSEFFSYREAAKKFLNH